MLYNPNLKFTVMLLLQLKKNEHLNILNIKELKILLQFGWSSEQGSEYAHWVSQNPKSKNS